MEKLLVFFSLAIAIYHLLSGKIERSFNFHLLFVGGCCGINCSLIGLIGLLGLFVLLHAIIFVVIIVDNKMVDKSDSIFFICVYSFVYVYFI
jgi:hypothetical protein